MTRVNSQSTKLVQINSDLRNIAVSVNTQRETIDKLETDVYCTSLASSLSFVIEQFTILQNSLVLLHKNIVSPDLFTPLSLKSVLNNAKENFGFRLLYGEDDLLSYYNVLTGKIVGNVIYVFVPFASENNMRVFYLVPFPTLLNDSLAVTLDVKESIVILNKNFESIAVTDKNSFKEDCLAISSGSYLCPAKKLHFFPASQYPCLLNVAVRKDITSSCNFKFDNHTSLAVKHISTYNYIFSKFPVKFTLTCGDTTPKLKELKGNFVVREDCGVYAPDLIKIYASHSRMVDDEVSSHVGNLILREFSFPTEHKKIVVQKMTTPPPLPEEKDYFLDLVNESHPYVTFVGVPLGMVLLVLGMCVAARIFYVKKAKFLIERVDRINNRMQRNAEEDVKVSQEL